MFEKLAYRIISGAELGVLSPQHALIFLKEGRCMSQTSELPKELLLKGVALSSVKAWS
jgi:hypothetical protein